jgi:hypothetical protein
VRFWSIFVWLLCTSAAAEVHVWLEPRIVDELDSIQLTLRATDTQVADTPDLSELQGDFEIMGSQTTSQRRSVNGSVESWVDYQYTLRPKRSGEIGIPPIRVGNQTSAPTSVLVRQLDPSIKQSIERMVFFETELTANPVYVQGQTVFIRRLYYANGVQLYSDLPGTPELANAVIVPLGETRSSSTLREGTRYGVIEQRFAIFPEQSGQLRIPESAITSSVRLRRDGRTRRSGIRISAPAQTLRVLPIPAEYPADTTWLPAAAVTLSETWSPQHSTFNLGDPITRSIAVTAQGNTGSAIPPLEVAFPDQHFKHYPESPILDDDASGGQVIGTRVEGYSLIPTAPGAAQLAPVTVTWWDVNARKVRTASLPARVLQLRGSVLPGDPPEASTAAAELPAMPAPVSPAAASKRSPNAALGLLAGLTLAALLGWLLYGRSRASRISPPPADKVASRRQAIRALKAARDARDVPRLRQGLLQVLQAVYTRSQDQALAHFLAEPEHQALWQRLNAAAYGPADTATIDPDLAADVWQAARRLKARRASKSENPLPPLYSTGA